MEKHTPHCKLALIRALVEAGRVSTTCSAVAGASALGMSLREMIRTVALLTPADFHKSMTTHADHRIWQDVYRPWTSVGRVYVKLTVIEDLLVVSFKEL